MSSPLPAALKSQFGSLLQILLSVLALGSGLLGGAGLFALGVMAGQSDSALRLNQDTMFAWVWAAVFLSLPAVPSFITAIRRVLGKTAHQPRRNPFLLASLSLLLFPLALAVGRAAAETPFLARFVFPIAAILAAGLPIWWVVELARRDLDAGSPQRMWGTLNFALYVSTPLVFVVEIIGLFTLVIAISVWAAGDAQSLGLIQRLQQQILQANGDMEALSALYQPLIRQPWVLFGAYTAVAVLVPLVEELFKPLALWFLLGRRPSPAAGFVLGAIAGAGFALPETLYNLAGAAANPQWLALATGRVGTSLLHICTTALTGMAIALVWRSGKFHYLALAYAAAAGLHGLWNALTITSGLAGIVLNENIAGPVSIAATAGLVALTAIFVVILIAGNRRLMPEPLPENSTQPTGKQNG